MVVSSTSKTFSFFNNAGFQSLNLYIYPRSPRVSC
jgi:hypothetical protein